MICRDTKMAASFTPDNFSRPGQPRPVHGVDVVRPTLRLQQRAPVVRQGREIAAVSKEHKQASGDDQSRPVHQQEVPRTAPGRGHTAADDEARLSVPTRGEARHPKQPTAQSPPTGKVHTAQNQSQLQRPPPPPLLPWQQQQQQGGTNPGAAPPIEGHPAVTGWYVAGTPSEQQQRSNNSPPKRTARRQQRHASRHGRKYAALVVKLSAASKLGQASSKTARIAQLCVGVQQALQQGRGFRPVALATHAAAINRLQQQPLNADLKQAVTNTQQALFSYLLKAGFEGFNIVQLSTVLQAAARVHGADTQVQQLLTAAMKQLKRLGAAPWLDRRSEACRPFTLSTMLWSFGKAGYDGDMRPLVAAVNAAVQAGVMETASAQIWSNTLWATAELSIPATDVQVVWDRGWACLEKQLSHVHGKHTGQHGRPSLPADRGRDVQGASASPEGRVLLPRDIANVLWAAAKTGYQPPAGSVAQMLVQAVDCDILSSATPPKWSNILWGVAKLGVPASSEMQRVWQTGISSVATALTMHKAAAQAVGKGHNINLSPDKAMPRQRSVSNIIWAAATAPSWQDPEGELAAQLVSIISDCCESALGGSTIAKDWSNMLWGATKLGVKLPEPVWREAGHELASGISDARCNPQTAVAAFEAATACQQFPVLVGWLKALLQTEGGKQMLQSADMGQIIVISRSMPSTLNSAISRDDKLLILEAAEACMQLLVQEVGAWQPQMYHQTMDSYDLVAGVAVMAQLGMFHPTLMSAALQQQLAVQCQAQPHDTTTNTTSNADSSMPAVLNNERPQDDTRSSRTVVTLLMAAARTLVGTQYSQQQLPSNADLVVSLSPQEASGSSSPYHPRGKLATTTRTAALQKGDMVLSRQQVNSLLHDAVRLMGTLPGGAFSQWDGQSLANLLWIWAALAPYNTGCRAAVAGSM